MYVNLKGVEREDFSFSRSGEYRRPVGTSGFFTTKAKPVTRQGRVCPACGLTRSVSNRCECNS